jgi:hypothetical protein
MTKCKAGHAGQHVIGGVRVALSMQGQCTYGWHDEKGGMGGAGEGGGGDPASDGLAKGGAQPPHHSPRHPRPPGGPPQKPCKPGAPFLHNGCPTADHVCWGLCHLGNEFLPSALLQSRSNPPNITAGMGRVSASQFIPWLLESCF